MTHPAIAVIQDQLAGLARESQTIAADLAREVQEATRWERSAVDAVRRGDDGAARVALERQEAHAQRAAIAELELARLREMQEACREFLATVGTKTAGLDATAPSNEKS